MYELVFTKTFQADYKRLTSRNKLLKKQTKKALQLLVQGPFYPSLKTHKVNTRRYGTRWSSWVTGDVRLIWDFTESKKLVIWLLDIGRHSGGSKIYK
ncbi:type II toxin-antitoxin system mRNA interferase toxin, RelE/StbE family [Patescibacteria group bacterium]|nr:type II toxin-antitoxin system mRNA interferase toxin, RelE/StbE family [Patescibacteria group bacterium]